MGRNNGAGREEAKYKEESLRGEAVKQEPAKTIKFARRAPNPSSLSPGRKEALPGHQTGASETTELAGRTLSTGRRPYLGRPSNRSWTR